MPFSTQERFYPFKKSLGYLSVFFKLVFVYYNHPKTFLFHKSPRPAFKLS